MSKYRDEGRGREPEYFEEERPRSTSVPEKTRRVRKKSRDSELTLKKKKDLKEDDDSSDSGDVSQ